jgi:2-keto-4-pentenoate hydratase
VGLGSPTMMKKLGLQAPLIGFLMQRALFASGSKVSLRGYINPVMEPEIGVRIARDVLPMHLRDDFLRCVASQLKIKTTDIEDAGRRALDFVQLQAGQAN